MSSLAVYSEHLHAQASICATKSCICKTAVVPVAQTKLQRTMRLACLSHYCAIDRALLLLCIGEQANIPLQLLTAHTERLREISVNTLG